jgi:hypothetical protein
VKTLIEYLYNEAECQAIKKMWQASDERSAIHLILGRRLLEKNSKLLPATSGTLLDILMLVCRTQSFAYDENEGLTVAVLLTQSLRDKNILPLLQSDRGVNFSRKALVSLALFYPAMEHKCRRYGAPSPEYYRQASKTELRRADYPGIAENHLKWEGFLSEVLV